MNTDIDYFWTFSYQTFCKFFDVSCAIFVRRIVWNTIDDRYSSFAVLSNVATFLGFTCFKPFSCH